jgi:hypothetical protein
MTTVYEPKVVILPEGRDSFLSMSWVIRRSTEFSTDVRHREALSRAIMAAVIATPSEYLKPEHRRPPGIAMVRYRGSTVGDAAIRWRSPDLPRRSTADGVWDLDDYLTQLFVVTALELIRADAAVLAKCLPPEELRKP